MIAARQGRTHNVYLSLPTTAHIRFCNYFAGCQVLIYPGAFNLTTGPLHWELLQRSRAVDNQVFVSMCSPARDMTAGYHAWGHSMTVDPMGSVLAEAGEGEELIFVTIDPEVLQSTRANIPVTVQRRFDVYPDVSQSLN